MAMTFNNTFVMGIKLKLLKLNRTAEFTMKCQFTHNLLNYNLIPGKDILNELGIIFNFKNYTVTW